MQYGNPKTNIYLEGVAMFKSYYVVWKLSEAQQQAEATQKQFKSYYVVWKPNILKVKAKVYFKFKSYYVVWKQHNRKIYNKSIYRFKSYYVVWKQNTISPDIISKGCLNRTMQYGNNRT